jgi:23S rRNA (cytidine2498-2'-O)-methyltransferase
LGDVIAYCRPGFELGAAPGSWIWQLVRRGLRVTVVDNGAMDAGLMARALVDHRREDDFYFRPRKSVDWLVCDMVEKPGRIAALVAQWCHEGWCREVIFNLKLPMKGRHETSLACHGDMEAALAGRRHRLRFKQLYHDPEEVTGHCRLI